MLFEQIKNLRDEECLIQEAVAKILNIEQGTYSDYERGIINVPVEAFIKLAKFYNVSVDYLLGLTNVSKPYPRKKLW